MGSTPVVEFRRSFPWKRRKFSSIIHLQENFSTRNPSESAFRIFSSISSRHYLCISSKHCLSYFSSQISIQNFIQDFAPAKIISIILVISPIISSQISSRISSWGFKVKIEFSKAQIGRTRQSFALKIYSIGHSTNRVKFSAQSVLWFSSFVFFNILALASILLHLKEFLQKILQ